MLLCIAHKVLRGVADTLSLHGLQTHSHSGCQCLPQQLI